MRGPSDAAAREESPSRVVVVGSPLPEAAARLRPPARAWTAALVKLAPPPNDDEEPEASVLVSRMAREVGKKRRTSACASSPPLILGAGWARRLKLPEP